VTKLTQHAGQEILDAVGVVFAMRQRIVRRDPDGADGLWTP